MAENPDPNRRAEMNNQADVDAQTSSDTGTGPASSQQSHNLSDCSTGNPSQNNQKDDAESENDDSQHTTDRPEIAEPETEINLNTAVQTSHDEIMAESREPFWMIEPAKSKDSSRADSSSPEKALPEGPSESSVPERRRVIIRPIRRSVLSRTRSCQTQTLRYIPGAKHIGLPPIEVTRRSEECKGRKRKAPEEDEEESQFYTDEEDEVRSPPTRMPRIEVEDYGHKLQELINPVSDLEDHMKRGIGRALCSKERRETIGENGYEHFLNHAIDMFREYLESYGLDWNINEDPDENPFLARFLDITVHEHELNQLLDRAEALDMPVNNFPDSVNPEDDSLPAESSQEQPIQDSSQQNAALAEMAPALDELNARMQDMDICDDESIGEEDVPIQELMQLHLGEEEALPVNQYQSNPPSPESAEYPPQDECEE